MQPWLELESILQNEQGLCVIFHSQSLLFCVGFIQHSPIHRQFCGFVRAQSRARSSFPVRVESAVGFQLPGIDLGCGIKAVFFAQREKKKSDGGFGGSCLSLGPGLSASTRSFSLSLGCHFKGGSCALGVLSPFKPA